MESQTYSLTTRERRFSKYFINLSLLCFILVPVIACDVYADYVIGDWETDLEGWAACGWDPPANSVLTPGVATGATLGSGALMMEADLGWKWALIVSVDVTQFLAHNTFEMDITRLPGEWDFSGSGWNGIDFRINSDTGGLVDLDNDNSWWSPPDGDGAVTASWDYSSYKEAMGSNPGFVEFLFITNNSGYNGTQGIYYLDNARLADPDELPSGKASEPNPADYSDGVGETPLLSWEAGELAGSHDVYLGTNFDDVNNATTSTAGIYLGRRSQSNYQITTPLADETQYYWRVDEINEVTSPYLWKGDVWRFSTIEPYIHTSTPWLHVDGNKIKDPVGNDVVLRGISIVDLGFIEGWRGGVLPMIDRITDKYDAQGQCPGWYPKIIRLPIYPPETSSSWPYRLNYDNDHFYRGILRPVVDYCKDKGVYVIIDWHYIDDTWNKVAETNEFWEYMAPKFADDSHVLYEIFNEPINFVGTLEENWQSVRQNMQTWVDIVRSHAPKNLLLVAGPSWSQMIGPIADNPIDGNNIIYVSHLYPSHWRFAWWYGGQIEQCAAVAPVIMTEWGFSQGYDPDPNNMMYGSITEYGQPLMDFVEAHQISYTAWCASYDWGPPMFNPDWSLRCGDGEMGCFVKQQLYERRNDDMPCDTSQFDIEVLPDSYDFGEVALGTPKVLTVSISNTGCGDLTVNGITLDTEFAITSFPPGAMTIEAGETAEVEITYTPLILGYNFAVLRIFSNDPDEPIVEVQLSATGVTVPVSPLEQIEDILEFFDECVTEGTIEGMFHRCDKWQNHNDFQLKIFRYMITKAKWAIEREWDEYACRQLRQIYLRCDGQYMPIDFVKGDSVDELAGKVEALMQTLGCR